MDVAHGNSVDDAAWSGLDAFICQRHDRRLKEEGRDRPFEEAWEASAPFCALRGLDMLPSRATASEHKEGR